MEREVRGASTAIVTGGGRGIGLAISRALAADGWDVAVADQDAPVLQAAVAALGEEYPERRFLAVSVDVASTESVNTGVQRTVSELGGVGALVNNAGIVVRQEVDGLSDEDWARVIEVDLTGPFRCARAAYPHLARSSGAVVNISSIAASLGISSRAGYTAAKAGLDGLTRTLALEWGRDGVRVNSVGPGWTETDMVSNAITVGRLSREDLTRRVPLGRLADPAEIAAVVAFLVSRGASYVTGQSLLVDGGFSVNGDT